MVDLPFPRLVSSILGFAILGSTLAFCAPTLDAQTTEPSSIDPSSIDPSIDPRIDAVLSRLERTRTFFETALSPDGRLIAWVVANDGGTEIDVAALSSPASIHRLTGSSGCIEDDLSWSPDSKELAFTSDCQGGPQFDLYLTSIVSQPFHASPPRRLTHLHGEVSDLAFSPDGQRIGFLYVEGGTRRAGALDAMKPFSGVIGEEGVEIQRFASADTASGEVLQITPPSLHVYEFDWSPDSGHVVYVAARPPGENNWWVAKLYTQAISQGEPQTIFDPNSDPNPDANSAPDASVPAPGSGPLKGMQIAVPRWSPDGKTIAFIGGLMSDQGSTGGDIYTVPSTGGNPRLLAISEKSTGEKSTISVAWIHWRDGQRLGFSYISGGSSGYGEVQGPSGAEIHFLIPATIGDGRLEQSISFAKDGQAAMIQSSFSSPPEVWAGDLAKDGGASTGLRQITHLNAALENTAFEPSWGKAESIEWTQDNLNVQGWLIYPIHYDPAKKYPLIVSVHGGPSSAVQPRWPSLGYNPVVFSALGYFVLMPNPRGSYGQGEDFTRANRKDFGYGDLRDILAGVDAVSARLPIDQKRIGLTGWSYGGFMTMFAVTQTQRFRAAVAGAGISDWESYYGENSIDRWLIPFFGASVYDDPAVYARSSAINFIGKAKTPTLIVVGDRDGECPAPQSFEFWHALRAQQVATRLVVYPDEGHRFVSRQHQRDVLERAFAWFEGYMPPDKE
jgi:dipeptidyl aminopeptidase/acylaminoacyl peptidase